MARACSPGNVLSMTLGGAVGGCAVRTVTVAVMLPSPNTVMFWTTPSARSAQACSRFSAVMSLGRYQYDVSQPPSPRAVRQRW